MRTAGSNMPSATLRKTWRCANSFESAERAGRLSAALKRTSRSWGWTTTNIVRGRPGIGTCGWCFWRSCFWCGCGCSIKKTPALTLPQARQLIEWSLPDPKREEAYVLECVQYHQKRNYQAYQSHRKRRLKELKKWKTLKMSL